MRLHVVEDPPRARGSLRDSPASVHQAATGYRRYGMHAQRVEVRQRHAGHTALLGQVPRGPRAMDWNVTTRVDHMRRAQHRVLVLLGRAARLGPERARGVHGESTQERRQPPQRADGT